MADGRQKLIHVSSVLTLALSISLAAFGASANKCNKLLLTQTISDSAGESIQLIPAVMNLKAQAAIPKAIIEEHSPSEIATSLVQRLSKNNRRITVKQGGFNPKTGTDMMMFFREESFASIVEKGFMNYHQTGSTHGESTLGGRAAQEDHLLQVNIEKGGYDGFVREKLIELYEAGKNDQKPKVMREAKHQSPYNRIRAKYAYLVIKDRSVDIGNTVFRNQYGTYGAVFKDETKPRATWTPTDSLAAQPTDIFTFQDQRVDIQAYGDRDVKYYFEAQIWGDLNIADVAYWIVPKGVNKDSAIFRAMKATGIPIRQYAIAEDVHPESRNTTYRPVVGKELK